MEKEALIEQLKEKVGETDFSVLSEKTVDALVTPLLPSFADDEKVTEDSWTMPVNLFKNFVGQYRHELAQGSEAEKQRIAKENESKVKHLAEDLFSQFKKDWEEKHSFPLKEDDKKGDVEKPSETEDLLKKLEGRLFGEDGKGGLIGGKLTAVEAFIDDTKKKEEAKNVEEIKHQLKDYLMKERKAGREAVVDLAISLSDIQSDGNISEQKVQVEKIYEEQYRRFYGDGGKPYGGDSTGGRNEADPDDDVKAYLEKRKKADEERAIKLSEVKNSFV